ncbi:MAG: HD domain-containing protein [Gemmatimonadetes bacterium]|nr:HD domain-containing protein [Gemmatimonadota bacterium]
MDFYSLHRMEDGSPSEGPAALDRSIREARIAVASHEDALRSRLVDALRSEGFANAVPLVGPGPSIAPCDVLVVDLGAPAADVDAWIRGAASAASQRPPPSRVGILPRDGEGLPQGTRPFGSVLRSPVEERLLGFAVRCQLLLRHSLGARERTVEEEAISGGLGTAPVEIELLHRMARAAEFRVDPSGLHVERVGALAALIGMAVGFEGDRARLLRHAAPLHDFGKMMIPDAVLLDPEPLAPEAFGLMKLHAAMGAEILRGMGHPVTDLAAEIAWSHHERWDGTGYPRGLSGEEIPLEARIVAVADLFDAVAHARGTPEDLAEGLSLLREERGGAFDPAVVDALLGLWADGRAAALYESDRPGLDPTLT